MSATSAPSARLRPAARRWWSQRARPWLARFDGPGLAVGLLFFTQAMGPALTPRSAVLQGASGGVCAVIGYGLTTGALALGRAVLGPRVQVPATRRRWGWRVLAAVTVPALASALWWSASWQRELRTVMGMEQPASVGSFVTLVTALVLALLLLLISRGLRVVSRRLARLIGRWLPAVVSRLLAVAAVAVVATLVLNGAVVEIGKATLERSFATLDDETFPGNVQPTLAERSGSPVSTQAWDTLGREGRHFVSTGPTLDQLKDFDASIGLVRTEREPIRVYAGRTSAPDLAGVAANVVAELDRTDAWDRSTLVVTTTTGTGWVDPSSARALELLWGGDTAIAAMQYSYLPSWVSFVGDRTTPGQAGVALLDAVRTRWLQLPAGHRPKLYVYGISLGSFGSQSAFGSLDDVLTRTDGALWVGTPGFTTLWGTLTAERDPGSPQIRPVLDGGAHVRWLGDLDADGTELQALGTRWDGPRVVYVQHPSDGVVWWSPDLLFHRPDWLREPRGSDVLPEVTWHPIVSFWQITIDLFVAGGAPFGHGHNYAAEYADGWAAVAHPDGWTDQDTLALRTVLTTAADS